MPTAYTSNLRLALPATGEDAGTWGNIVNNNITSMVEQAVTGYAVVTMPSDANYTLTTANGVSDQARNASLSIASSVSLTATRTIVIPTVPKLYVVANNTTGGQSISFSMSAGLSYTVPNGGSAFIWCDGATGVYSALTFLSTLSITTATITTDNVTNFTASTSAAVPTVAYPNSTTNAASTAWVSTNFAPMASGTLAAFQQNAAPTGWTKQTTSNDALLRIVSGTPGTGGSTAFSTWNTSGTTGAHTLTAAEIPTHTHAITDPTHFHGPPTGGTAYVTQTGGTINTSSTGGVGLLTNTAAASTGISITNSNGGSNPTGGGSHTHPLSNNILYVDFIIAQKN